MLAKIREGGSGKTALLVGPVEPDAGPDDLEHPRRRGVLTMFETERRMRERTVRVALFTPARP